MGEGDSSKTGLLQKFCGSKKPTKVVSSGHTHVIYNLYLFNKISNNISLWQISWHISYFYIIDLSTYDLT